MLICLKNFSFLLKKKHTTTDIESVKKNLYINNIFKKEYIHIL